MEHAVKDCSKLRALRKMPVSNFIPNSCVRSSLLKEISNLVSGSNPTHAEEGAKWAKKVYLISRKCMEVREH